MPETPEALKLAVQPHNNVRMKIYERIGQVHRQVVKTRQLACMAGESMSVDPELILHCEQAVAFLAEEILRVGAEMECLSKALLEKE